MVIFSLFTFLLFYFSKTVALCFGVFFVLSHLERELLVFGTLL